MADTLTRDVIAQTSDVTIADVLDKDALLAELAALDPMEYDKRRADTAKLLGVRVGTLDAAVAAVRAKAEAEATATKEPLVPVTPLPWDESVDGAQLLDELAAWYTTYVVLPDGAATLLSLWTLHTYAMDAAQVSPRLAIVSPQKRCGKTTLMALVGMVTPRAMAAANITAAALFRAIEGWRPTMLIDEADTFLKENEELRGVLNAGHFRPNAYVVRAVPLEDTWIPQAFRVWGPVAIALIGRLPSTLADRSITVKLRRKAKGETVERLRLDRPGNAEELRRRCQRWGQDQLTVLKECDPDVPAILNDRAADNWRPLCAIAQVAGREWPERAKQAMTALAASDVDDGTVDVMLLGDIKKIFAERQTQKLSSEDMDKLSSEDLVAALHTLEERPWAEWGKEAHPITKNQLAARLRPFDIKPSQIRTPDKTRGYKRDDFTDAWLRYLPDTPSTPQQEGDSSGTSVQTSNGAGEEPTRSGTQIYTTSGTSVQTSNSAEIPASHSVHASNGALVPERIGLNPASQAACTDVPDRAQFSVPDDNALNPASQATCTDVPDQSPRSQGGDISETEHPPCTVCRGRERWNDCGIWRCVTCWPQSLAHGARGDPARDGDHVA